MIDYIAFSMTLEKILRKMIFSPLPNLTQKSRMLPKNSILISLRDPK